MKLKAMFLVIILTALQTTARSRWVTATYEMGFASPNFKEFIDEVSFQGFGFNFHESISTYFMLGGRVGWNNFQTKIDRDIYKVYEDGYFHTASLTQYRRVSSLSVLFEGTFVAHNSTILIPYLSTGLGMSWDRKEQIIGSRYFDKSTGHFIMRPEIGLIVPYKKVGLKVSGGYNGIVNNSNRAVDHVDHFTIGVGIAVGEFHK